MRSAAWQRLESLVSNSSAPTSPRAYGELLEQLLENFNSSPVTDGSSFQAQPLAMEDRIEESHGDWQAWQMQKELGLLAASAQKDWQKSESLAVQ
jgi:hypothetical protein